VAEKTGSGQQSIYAGENPAPGTKFCISRFGCKGLPKKADVQALFADHSRFVMENYDEAASRHGEKYECERWRKNVPGRRDYEQTRKSLLYHINNRQFENVLEIGCGVGTWTVLFRNYCKNMTLVDISKEMLQTTISRLRRLNFHDVCGVLCDFQASALNSKEKYDAIFSIRAIEYMVDKTSVLSNMYRLLDDNGFVLIVTKNPHRGLIPFLSLITQKTFRQARLFAHRIHYKNLAKLARKAGFTSVEVYPTIVSHPIASYDTVRPLFIEKNEALLSNAIFDSIYKKRLNPFYLPLGLIESYCLIARK